MATDLGVVFFAFPFVASKEPKVGGLGPAQTRMSAHEKIFLFLSSGSVGGLQRVKRVKVAVNLFPVRENILENFLFALPWCKQD
ncbi:MAG: hypothetical protein WB795_21365 [Candidatus Acidiferrales bacterium]